MTSKKLALFLCVFFCITWNEVSAHTHKYRITQNGVPFEKQLSVILDDIKQVPESDNIVIIVESGYYSVSKTINISGDNHKISLVGSKNKETIISGSILVEGWELQPDGLWRCKVPKIVDNGYMPDQLFVNGERATRSRIPNDTTFFLKQGIRFDSISYGAKLRKEDMDLIPTINDDDIPLLNIYRKWTAAKRFLARASEQDTTLYFTGLEIPSYIKLWVGNGLIIENVKGGIDKPGEWCVDKKGYLYYMPKADESLDKTEFRIPIVEKLFCIQTEKGIDLKNIVFEHTTYQIPKEGVEDVQAGAEISAAIEIDNANHLKIENCELRNIANYGIWFRQRCNKSKVSKSYFHELGAGAIKIGTLNRVDSKELTKHIIVDNNLITNYGNLYESAVGIVLFNASDCVISHNDIHYGEYTGISLGWVWSYADSPSKRNEVSYNRISHIGTGNLDDMGGIYTVGRSEGTHIHHNVISDVNSKEYRGWGLFADAATSNIVFDRNLAYNCTSGGFHQDFGTENIVTNNIFAWGTLSQSTFSLPKGEVPVAFTHNIIIMKTGALFTGCDASPDMGDKVVPDSNCYWSVSSDLPIVYKDDVLTWIKQKDSSSIYQDPCFRDPENMDFRFKNKAVMKKIGFVPFDYTKAGVYGNRKWKRLACSKYDNK